MLSRWTLSFPLVFVIYAGGYHSTFNSLHVIHSVKVNKITMIDESRFPEDILAEADEEADTTEEPVNEFDGLDLRGVICFGYGCPKANSWTNLA